MTTYADDIEEANDGATRKARVDALFGTKMAALMAASDGGATPQTAFSEQGQIVPLRDRSDEAQQDATAAG